MAVLKIVPKLYQEKISEKLKEEIALVTTGEAKYYNRLYKFFQYTDIQCTADINYETRKMYMDSLEKEDISEKYKAELLSLFDRLKIENMPDVYSQGKPFSVEQEFFKQDKLFLLYVPNKKKAQSFRQVVDKNDLLWDLTRIHSSQLVRQTKILLCEILNMDKVQRHKAYREQGACYNPKQIIVDKVMEEKLNTLKIAVTKLKKENIKLTLQNEELLKEIERLKLQLEKK